ncbi:LacI family transcriptional regulator [Xylanimonas allomyrinae]|uniref:LacI family transcriptional regulator n=1 Tax=Xylanimonas allomyrinae TaxID=2509459 RepID=A0A4P6F1J9_9MICO|nr:LacI family DNA-binding transcriptional regulator [Xylanimonas allomyrinae]QAY64208.1 LacI family transcriptional regulator [Xylanimonas allomyrinae]
MAVTMHDVARLAGVSIKTVSNVVNDYPYIRPQTRARVEAAIETLGYELNVTARQLKQGRTGMIGLAVPDLRVPYFSELAYSVMRAAEDRGLTLLIEQTGPMGERELDALRGQKRRLTDGLIFSPVSMSPDDTTPLAVTYPLVLLGERVFQGPVDHVTMANVEGAKAAASHLVERGCRHVAVIGAHPGEVVGSAGLRLKGFQAGLTEAGLTPDPRLVGVAGRWVHATGAEAMRQVLDTGAPVDGVFAMNDALALGALRELHRRGFAVPDDVAVVGFDNIAQTLYSEPPLTTIDVSRKHIAHEAVRMLIERMEGLDVAPRLLTAPFELVERASTARQGTT